MTPQELKASILQMAIQGKLVEQRPEEGTGEKLYQQIQTEKQALIKSGKIKKEKSLPEITEDEIPFDIPENWKWYRLGELFNIVNGFTPLKSNPEFWEEGDIPWFTIEDIHRQGRFISSTEKFITRKALSKNTERIVPADTVLLCCTASVGEYAYTKIPLTTNQQFNAFVLKEHYKKAVYPLYVFEYAKTLKGSLIDRAGKTTFNFVSVGKLSNMLIPLPPLAEQKRIVAKIEELLPLIDRYEQTWSRLEKFNKRFPVDMQKSILQMAIQGKLVEQRPEEGTGEDVFQRLKPYHKGLKPCKDELDFSSMDFDIPESWTMVELNQLFDFVDYRGKTPTKISEGVFLITASNIRRAYMDYTRKEYISRDEYEGRQSRGITQKGDLLFTTEAPMGNAALCDLDECSCGQRIITFKEYTEETVLPALFMYFILSPHFQQQLLDNCTGTTAKGIKADKLKHFLLPLPPYDEQKRIVAKLEEILPLCERLK